MSELRLEGMALCELLGDALRDERPAIASRAARQPSVPDRLEDVGELVEDRRRRLDRLAERRARGVEEIPAGDVLDERVDADHELVLEHRVDLPVERLDVVPPLRSAPVTSTGDPVGARDLGGLGAGLRAERDAHVIPRSLTTRSR